MTETEIEKGDLPANVFKSLSLRFDGFEIEEAEKLENPDFSGFEILLEKNDTEIEVLAAKSGELTIKDVLVEDEDEGGCKGDAKDEDEDDDEEDDD
ncbi:hypothetical protein HQ585_21060 [candidate division KSB1 bacterium]|nr:hypothetical protein [candidate division KSB1 bacterium]